MQVRWINVQGFSWDVIECLARRYELHPLSVEDIVHIPQRIKADYFPVGGGGWEGGRKGGEEGGMGGEAESEGRRGGPGRGGRKGMGCWEGPYEGHGAGRAGSGRVHFTGGECEYKWSWEGGPFWGGGWEGAGRDHPTRRNGVLTQVGSLSPPCPAVDGAQCLGKGGTQPQTVYRLLSAHCARLLGTQSPGGAGFCWRGCIMLVVVRLWKPWLVSIS